MFAARTRRGARSLGALLLACVAFVSACRHGDARPASVDATDSTYDVIVVGSGAGGGPLAARLARSGKRVLLLEAGADPGGALRYDVPAMHALSTEDPETAWWYFVSHHADAAIDAADSKHQADGALYPRGSALGGSTAVNAMVTVLPSRSDWNRLAAIAGEPAFRADAMARYEDRVREWFGVEIPAASLAEGDRKVTSFLGAAATAFAARRGGGAIEAASSLATLLGRDLNAALRGGEAEGVYRLPLATRGGRRSSARDAITGALDAGAPLTVVTGAFVTRVLWSDADPTAAIGVELVRQRNVYGASLAKEKRTAPAEAVFGRRIVLAAGAFNSPQILGLSGVGDPAELARLGVEVHVLRPGVGKNLQDRYEAPVVTRFATPLEVVAKCGLAGDPARDPCVAEWRDGGGVYTTPGFLATTLLRSSPDAPLADLQIFAVPTEARGYYPGYSADGARAKDRFTWLLLKAHTRNHDGTVTLKSADPFTRPVVAFRDFDEKDPLHDPDLRALVSGVKFVREVEAKMRESDPDDAFDEIWPGDAARTDDELAAWIRKETWGHHACCTDKMGLADDPDAVVDGRFRVIGAKHLFVVDASVFPEIPGTFLAMPTYMLAERAADAMLEDLARDATDATDATHASGRAR